MLTPRLYTLYFLFLQFFCCIILVLGHPLFFWGVSNRSFIKGQNNILYSQWWTQSIVKNYKQINRRFKTDGWNSKMDVQCAKPMPVTNQIEYGSTRTSTNQIGLTTSLNMRLFHSFHTNHVKHAGTKFHTCQKCFPNQFSHSNRRDATVSSVIHWIPNLETFNSTTHMPPQILETLYSTTYMQWNNGAKDDLLFPHNTDTYNTNLLGIDPSSWGSQL